MPPRPPIRRPLAALGLIGVLAAGGPGPAIAGPRAPGRIPLIVLASPAGGERPVEAPDLVFAYYRRTVYARRAPRSEVPGGRVTEVEDRRKECRCLRFQDWSRKKFKKLRQIEIAYPSASAYARVRITGQDGTVREFPASELYGSDGAFPPRLVVTIDGVRREYPLALAGESGESWPEEKPVRILLVGSATRRR
jgi:hypothetical protein